VSLYVFRAPLHPVWTKLKDPISRESLFNEVQKNMFQWKKLEPQIEDLLKTCGNIIFLKGNTGNYC
jgi:hypothetical protein